MQAARIHRGNIAHAKDDSFRRSARAAQRLFEILGRGEKERALDAIEDDALGEELGL